MREDHSDKEVGIRLQNGAHGGQIETCFGLGPKQELTLWHETRLPVRSVASTPCQFVPVR
jgi:hypothetical protein